MSSRLQAVLLVAVVLCGWCQLAAASETAVPPKTSSAPQDLYLTPDEIAQTEALSNFAWGFFLQLSGPDKPDGFIRYYEEALKQDPDSVEILEQLVGPLLMERRFDQIVKILEPVSEANPDAVQLLLVLTEALTVLERADEAVALLESRFKQLDEWSPLLFRELYVAYWRDKRFADVEALLRHARRRAGQRFVIEQASALYHNARAEMPDDDLSPRRRKDLAKRARRYARRALALVDDADRASDVESLASFFFKDEDWESLVRLLEPVRQRVDLFTPELGLLLVQGLRESGRTDEALTVLDDVAALDFISPQLFVELGRLYASLENLRVAEVYYERAFSSYPKSLQVQLRYAYLLLQVEKYERVLVVLGGQRKQPPEAHFLRSHALKQLGRDKEAARALAAAENEALSIGHDEFFSISFYLFYATLCEELGHTERALEKARKALELDPTDPVCANFLGYVLADHCTELEEAEKWIRLAVEAEPENFAYLDSLAWVYFREKRFADALAAISHALRRCGADPDPVILDHAGDIYAANGYRTLAEQYWRQALASGAKNVSDIEKKLNGVSGAREKTVPVHSGNES